MFGGFSIRQKITALIVLNLILSLPGLWVPFYNTDELTNALYARFLNHGDLALKDFLGSTYLLTHYLYKWVFYFVDKNSLVFVHIVHAIWKSMTIMALYFAGKNLGDAKVGVWSALFYCVFSTCFMSKDFHTPSAESLSLLPAALCAGFFFRGLATRQIKYFFIAGILIGLATFFKAPMGMLLIAAVSTTFTLTQRRFQNSVILVAGFFLVLLFPSFLILPFGSGFSLLWERVNETHTTYILAHSGLSFLYWVVKFFIRTALVFICLIGMTGFAFYGLQPLFRFNYKHRVYWQKIFFLFLWLVLMWFAVAIGKRVFYHYYVFLLPSLSLLAGSGLSLFDRRVLAARAFSQEKLKQFFYLLFLRRHLTFFLILPTAVFFLDAAFNFSTKPTPVAGAIAYIKEHTRESDRIYVWGNVPQLYFYTDRQPSTVYFWSDILAGTSPGSPAMEYVRATNASLNLAQMVRKDFDPSVFANQDPAGQDPAGPDHKGFGPMSLSRIGDSELFTVRELLERIDHYYWQKAFADFLHNPPELFIDSSPANIRGFGYFPLRKYELLKRFVWDNYDIETVVDGLIIYRRRK